MKKIKKLLTIGLAILLMLCMNVSLSACDNPVDSSNSSQSNSSCEHTYKWDSNEYGHQKVYTCGCSYPDIVELHSDNDTNAYCDICGYYVGVEESITPVPDPDKSIISLAPEIENQFDLSQEKIWWNSDTNTDFADDKIVVIFKKTTIYPELSIEDFNFENAESIEYLFLRPTGGLYDNENYRQMAAINLKEKGRDKVIEALCYFERISIILYAGPEFEYSIEEIL
ncbi:MAG: hypothetical protein IJX96_03215 [Clostridia bacterium]|nr:hypothetical protein [Clostridia bacterium]